MSVEINREENRRRAALTRRALLYGSLALAALLIFAANVLAMLRLFWQPAGVLALPVYFMFAAAALLAGISFYRTRSQVLYNRDHPEPLEEPEGD